MGGTAAVGREREFQALLDAADDAQAGRGAVVFLAGATGSGKSALLREFAAELASRSRGEQILFAHAGILSAARSPEASGFFARAQQVVRDKANTLVDPAHKQSFLERVPLSREILNAPT